MEPVAQGRDSQLFDAGPGRLLRRARSGRSMAHEARVMTYAREHGFPVPEVYELRSNDTELVMERIDGPLMMDMMPRPWQLRRQLHLLADLHDQLHEIDAPDWLPTMPDGGDRLVHLDLHPMNIILSARGPIVIDWPNARGGEALTDTALTYVLMTCPSVPGPSWLTPLLRPFRNIVGNVFAKRYAGPAFDARVAEMAELKCFDTNMTPAEVAAMRRLAARRRG